MAIGGRRLSVTAALSIAVPRRGARAASPPAVTRATETGLRVALRAMVPSARSARARAVRRRTIDAHGAE